IFGPPRSSRTPTHRSARAVASRTNDRRRRRSSTVPCEALSRTTSSPARIISVNTEISSVAGPTVATIFVRRNIISSCAVQPLKGDRCATPKSSGATRRSSQLTLGSFLKYGDRGQCLALDELEKRSATGGNVRNPVLDVVLLDRGQGIAAAGERERLAAGDGVSDRARALAELLEFEHAHGTVPDDGSGGLQQLAEAIGSIRANIQNHLIAAHVMDRAHIRVGRCSELLRNHHVRRQRNFRA